jgi:O-antigen/teichoic acid export membrane protein
MSAPSIAVNAVLNSAKYGIMALFPLITFPYSSRVLGPESMGAVNFAGTFVTYFTLLAGLGIYNYGIREGARLKGSREKLSRFANEMLALHVCSSLAALVLFIAAAFVFPALASRRLILFVSGIVIISNIIGLDWLYAAVENYKHITFSTIFFHVISVALLFLFIKNPDHRLRYAAWTIFTSVCVSVFNFAVSKKYVSIDLRRILASCRIAVFQKHLKPVILLFFVLFFSNFYRLIGTTLLGFLVGDSGVGYYSVAQKITNLVQEVISAALAVFLPQLSKTAAMENKAGFSALVKRAFLIAMVLALPACVLLRAFSSPVILIFLGPKYAHSIPVLRILSFSIVLTVLMGFICNQILLPRGREKIMLFGTVLGAAANLGLNLLFIPKWGEAGTALALLFSGAFSVLLLSAGVLFLKARAKA